MRERASRTNCLWTSSSGVTKVLVMRKARTSLALGKALDWSWAWRVEAGGLSSSRTSYNAVRQIVSVDGVVYRL